MGEFLDGEASPAWRHAIESHLDGCAECTTFMASYRQVIEAAEELRDNEPPLAVDVQNRLRKALNQRLGINLSYIA